MIELESRIAGVYVGSVWYITCTPWLVRYGQLKAIVQYIGV